MAENFIAGETVSLSAGTSGAAVSFGLAQSANYPDCLITNVGSVTAFIGFGNGAAELASLPGNGAVGAFPVPAGISIILHKGAGNATCAAITASGTATLYFTAGQGN